MLPSMRLVAPQRRQVVLHMRLRMEHVRHGRCVPGLPSSVGSNAVPVVQPLVGSLPLVS